MKFRSRIPLSLPCIALLCAAAMMCACSHKEASPPSAGLDTDIWSGDSLYIASDTLHVGTLSLHADSAAIPPVPPEAFTYRSEQPIVDLLYAREANQPPAERCTDAYLLDAFLCPTIPTGHWAMLQTRLNGYVVVPRENRYYCWPVMADNALWLLSASECARANGAEWLTRLTTTVLQRALDIDTRVVLNRVTGLFEGLPSYFLRQGGNFPTWMGPVDLFQCQSLTNNVAYYGALDINRERLQLQGATDPDTLRRHINTLMWQPNLGFYSGLLYGDYLAPIELSAVDMAGQSLAVLTGCASQAMTRAMVSKTPFAAAGVEWMFPRWAVARPSAASAVEQSLPRPLLQALWCAAIARSGNENAASKALAGLLTLTAAHQADTAAAWTGHPMTAYIQRSLLGMQYAAEGTYIVPLVPQNLPGEKHIKGLQIRLATYDVTLRGTGRAIATFTLDGKPSTPFLPANLEGNHTITITLAGPTADGGSSVPLLGHYPQMPPVPQVSWSTPQKAQLTMATPLLLYVNGAEIQEYDAPQYLLPPDNGTTTVAFAAVGADDGYAGFIARPHTYSPPGYVSTISTPDIATPGSRMIKDRKMARQFVESNRWKNATLRLTFNAQQAGIYAVDVSYLCSLGAVNPRRRTAALRQLRVNGLDCGMLVFPQLTPPLAQHGKDTGWQTLTTYSNALYVPLVKGDNLLEIRYFQPSPVYIDPMSNTLLANRIRLRRQ